MRIRQAEDLRVYRPGTKALLRALAYQRDQRTAFLWAQGFIPRLQSEHGIWSGKRDFCSSYVMASLLTGCNQRPERDP